MNFGINLIRIISILIIIDILFQLIQNTLEKKWSLTLYQMVCLSKESHKLLEVSFSNNLLEINWQKNLILQIKKFLLLGALGLWEVIYLIP